MAHDHELVQCSVYFTYYRHDGLETGFSHLKHLRPQDQPRMRLRVLVLDKQRQKHQRPDVAGSRPTNTATCDQYYMGRDRQQQHLRQI